MAKAFYNAGLVEREHKYLCSLRNLQAHVHYTTMHSKRPGDMSIAFEGHKSGSRTLPFSAWGEPSEDVLQPSHLGVSVTVHTRLLTDPLDTYPCYVQETFRDATTVVFRLHDADAVKHLLYRLDPTYQCVLPMAVKFFVDWIKLDAHREKKSAIAIQRQVFKALYSPASQFHLTQTRSDAALIMRATQWPEAD